MGGQVRFQETSFSGEQTYKSPNDTFFPGYLARLSPRLLCVFLLRVRLRRSGETSDSFGEAIAQIGRFSQGSSLASYVDRMQVYIRERLYLGFPVVWSHQERALVAGISGIILYGMDTPLRSLAHRKYDTKKNNTEVKRTDQSGMNGYDGLVYFRSELFVDTRILQYSKLD